MRRAKSEAFVHLQRGVYLHDPVGQRPTDPRCLRDQCFTTSVPMLRPLKTRHPETAGRGTGAVFREALQPTDIRPVEFVKRLKQFDSVTGCLIGWPVE